MSEEKNIFGMNKMELIDKVSDLYDEIQDLKSELRREKERSKGKDMIIEKLEKIAGLKPFSQILDEVEHNEIREEIREEKIRHAKRIKLMQKMIDK